MRLPLLLLLAACGTENNLNKQESDPPGFDSGEPVDTFETDTEETDTDTTDTYVTPPFCDDQGWPEVAIPQLDECYSEGTVVGTFTPVIEWTNTAPGDTYTTPVIGQLTDDDGNGYIDDNDLPDVVVANVSGALWAMSGDGTTMWSTGSLGSEPMTPAIGDLDGDGFPEVVGAGPNGVISVHGEDGSPHWSASGPGGGQCGGVGIADLDADGEPEVMVGAMILYGSDGSTRGRGSYGTGSGYGSSSVAMIGAAADIDADGIQEMVVGNALYDADGNTLWTNGQTDGFVAIADFDGDRQGEIVVTNVGRVRLQDDDGTVLWSGSYTGSTSGPPTVADFDGDGEPEIGVAGHNQYVVIDTDGTLLWTNPTYDSSSGFTGSSVFDFEGDGLAEVVYADEQNVYVYDGATGAIRLTESAHSSATCSEYPSVADVDGDGHAEIIYSSSAYSGSERGVTVIGDADDSWMAGRQVWNEHAYSITNVDEDGQIPASPDLNWLTYNNFRSGDEAPGLGYSGPDLYVEILDVCIEECADGNVTIWYAVGNQGFNDVEDDVTLEFWGQTSSGEVLLGSKVWNATLTQAIRTASDSVELTGVPTPLFDIEVRIDGGDQTAVGVVNECHEDNNVTTWGEVVCP